MTSREILNRRSFLRRASGAAFGLGAFHTLFDLRLLNSAMAATDVSDYKALVCLFLNGGNDGGNTLIPWDAQRYTENYRATRGPRLALWRDAAEAAARADAANNPNNYFGRALTEIGSGSQNYAVHGSMPEVQALHDQGKLAFVSGVGVLVEPLTRAQYRADTRRKPPQLFSHNDQVTQWQTSLPDTLGRSGWGGRTIDKMREELIRLNIPPGSISMSVSMAGSNTWEVGDTVNQFQVGTSGAVSITNYETSAARKTLIDRILRDPAAGGDSQLDAERVNLHLRDFQAVNERALYNGASLATALNRLTAGQADAVAGSAINTAFGIGGAVTYANLSGLEQQLHTISRIIAERSFLGMRRQIFFCSVGGYDTHGDQPAAHAGLLATLSRSMGKFHAATAALGIPEKVTAFTASDFSRTFKSNGLGSDHAWANHHMVMGGAVRGGRIYGTFPNLALGGPDDTDNSNPTGRFIPTTSTDEYAATLSRWFGLGEGELDIVYPNLDRFATRNLGFMG